MPTFKSISLLVLLTVALVTGAFLSQPGPLDAMIGSPDEKGKTSFGVSSLLGSYGTAGRADGSQSRSVGVADFDGRGGVSRTVRVNASNGNGGRKLIDLTSIGTYSVNSDGTGVICFLNLSSDGVETPVKFDFVIRTTELGRGKGTLLANSLEAVQQEAGSTGSMIEESFTRRNGVKVK
jgi:hypothetical protein